MQTEIVYQMLIYKELFGKLNGDDINYSTKVFLYIQLPHHFLLFVIISKPNLNSLYFLLTIQGELFTTEPMDYGSVWVQVSLGTTSLDSDPGYLKNCKFLGKVT